MSDTKPKTELVDNKIDDINDSNCVSDKKQPESPSGSVSTESGSIVDETDVTENTEATETENDISELINVTQNDSVLIDNANCNQSDVSVSDLKVLEEGKL